MKDAVHVSLQSNCAFGFSMMSIIGITHGRPVSLEALRVGGGGDGKNPERCARGILVFLKLKMGLITLETRITREIPLTWTTG